MIFSDQTKTLKEIRQEIERAIKKEFKLEIRVMLRSAHNLKEILESIPSSWREEPGMCPYIAFLWEEIDTPDITKQIGSNIKTENIKYIPGALLWNIESKNWSKDSVYKFTNGKMSKNITVRNINTLIKLVELI